LRHDQAFYRAIAAPAQGFPETRAADRDPGDILCAETMRLAFLLPILALAAASAPAQDWSRFRGPNGSGVAQDAAYPAEFSKDKNLVWRTPVRPGKSSPVLTSRHVFLSGFADKKLYLQCLDRETGKLLWERSQDQPRQEDRNLLNEPASPTPVTDGQNVYVLFPDLGLLSYDSSGKLRWKTPLGPFTNVMGLSASPVLSGDLVVVVADQQDDSYIAAFDKRNGEIRWKTARTEQDGWGTPVIFHPPAGSPQLLTASRGQLGSHAAHNGSRAWSYERLSPAIVASPVLEGDTLFTFGYGNDSAAPFSTVLERNDKNGDGVISRDEQGNNAFHIGIGKYEGNRDGVITKEEWDQKQREVMAASSLLAIRIERDPDTAGAFRPRELWRYERNFVGVIPSPLLYQGLLYIIRNGGILTNFDAATGEPVKAARIPAPGGYSASPVAADGKLYLAGEEGKVTVIRPGREWEPLAVNDLGEPCYATPALSGGSLYLRTAEALYRFAAR
jgi:outer membrane protein assembly factor BamB